MLFGFVFSLNCEHVFAIVHRYNLMYLFRSFSAAQFECSVVEPGIMTTLSLRSCLVVRNQILIAADIWIRQKISRKTLFCFLNTRSPILSRISCAHSARAIIVRSPVWVAWLWRIDDLIYRKTKNSQFPGVATETSTHIGSRCTFMAMSADSGRRVVGPGFYMPCCASRPRPSLWLYHPPVYWWYSDGWPGVVPLFSEHCVVSLRRLPCSAFSFHGSYVIFCMFVDMRTARVRLESWSALVEVEGSCLV